MKEKIQEKQTTNALPTYEDVDRAVVDLSYISACSVLDEADTSDINNAVELLIQLKQYLKCD